MRLTRRESLRLVGGGMAAAGLVSGLRAYAARRGVQFKVGATDWNLKLENDPGAIALAKRLGFDGVSGSSALA